jgi:hypothetical protein
LTALFDTYCRRQDMKKLILATLALALSSAAFAKLPPPTDEQKAAAAAAKDKAAWADKVAAYKLCMAQDKVAARYLKDKGLKKPSIETPPCVNPGPYVPPVADAGAATSTPATATPAAAAKPAAAPAKK